MIFYTTKHKIPFQIDAIDLDLVSKHTWHVNGGYVKTNIKNESGKWCSILLHIFLLGPAPEGLEWDHKNRNTMDNYRDNLRAVTPIVNRRNRTIRYDSSSGINGVRRFTRYNGEKCWQISIRNGGPEIYIGLFDSLEEAAQARKDAEDKYWGTSR